MVYGAGQNASHNKLEELLGRFGPRHTGSQAIESAIGMSSFWNSQYNFICLL